MKQTLLFFFLFLGFNSLVTAQIADGSFEAGAGSGNWMEASTNFGTPICDVPTCGDGGGTVNPNTGDFFVWFGGANAVETGSVSQSVVITESTAATLNMMVKVADPGPGLMEDRIEISIDGDILKTITALDTVEFQADYALSSIDILAYADGNSHEIKIEGFQTTATSSNILVDDVEMVLDTIASSLFNQFEAKESVRLYPNPVEDMVNLDFQNVKGEVLISITDISGSIIDQDIISLDKHQNFSYNTSKLNAGFYSINLISDNGSTSKMFVKSSN